MGRSEADYLSESGSLMQEDRWEVVRALMEEAIAEFPESPELRLRYAQSLLPFPDSQAAIAGRRAISLSGEDPSLLVRCASLMISLECLKEAKECLERAAPHVDEAFPLMGEMCGLIGTLAVEAGNMDVAAQQLRLAFEIDPHDHGNAYRYARFLVEQEDDSKALDVIALALEQGTPDREALLELREWLLACD